MHRAALAFVLLLASTVASAKEPAPPPASRAVPSAVAQNLARIDKALAHTAGVAEDARDEKDLAKLVCVDEKLRAMRQLADVATAANVELLSMTGGEDAVVVSTNATKIAVARARVEALRNEADRCLGALLHRTSDTTSVEVREPSAASSGASRDTALGVMRRRQRAEEASRTVDPDATGRAPTAR